MTSSRDLAYLCRELKAPSLLAGVGRLAERARTDAWSHEDFLAACLEREVSSRQSHGGENRIAAARFPARKTLEDFDFDHQRSVRKDVVAHLGASRLHRGSLQRSVFGPTRTWLILRLSFMDPDHSVQISPKTPAVAGVFGLN